MHNNQVSLNFPPYKCHEKKLRFSSKNMKISHKKQILDVLPILNDSDEAWAWSWIYSAFIFSILEVWRAVILFLKTILWGLLFGNLVRVWSCIEKRRNAYRNCYVIILKWRNSRKHCMYNEIWWNNKTKGMTLTCLCLHVITAVNNVFWNSLHLPSPCWSYQVSASITRAILWVEMALFS